MIGSIASGGNDHRLVSQMMKSIETKVPMKIMSAMNRDVTESKRLVRNFSRSRSLAVTRGLSTVTAVDGLGVDAMR